MTAAAAENYYGKCETDGRCLYARGHLGKCSTTEVAEHVLSLRLGARKDAVRAARGAAGKAAWSEGLEGLVQEGASPLLEVGYVVKGGELWHTDRGCSGTAGRAGGLVARLYLEVTRTAGLRACGRCVRWEDEAWARARADATALRLAVGTASGGCAGRFGGCESVALEGEVTCAEHLEEVGVECQAGGEHLACDGKGKKQVRKDGSEYRTGCVCPCHSWRW